MLKEAKALARASVVTRFAKQETAEAGARAAREAAQQEVDFSALQQQVGWFVGRLVREQTNSSRLCLPEISERATT